MPDSGIYQWRNLINGKCYIGSSVCLARRKNTHLSKLRRGISPHLRLQNAWNKHGEDAFVFEALITCDPTMCIWYEQQFLDQWQPEYNLLLTAGSLLGYKHTDKTKRKMSLAHRGISLSTECKRKISLALQGSRAPRSKLVEADIPTIRRSAAMGDSITDIAAYYDVSDAAISRAVHNVHWSHVDSKEENK